MSALTPKLPALPDLTDTLFVSAEDWWNNACLNYFPSGWTIYAIGYKEAADIAIRFCPGVLRQSIKYTKFVQKQVK